MTTLTIQAIEDALSQLVNLVERIDFIAIHPDDTLQVFRSVKRAGFTLTRQHKRGRIYTVSNKGYFIAEIYIPLPHFASSMKRGQFIPIPRQSLKPFKTNKVNSNDR